MVYYDVPQSLRDRPWFLGVQFNRAAKFAFFSSKNAVFLLP
jgi:hypothetical protein